MSASSEETSSTVADQISTDAETAGHQNTAINEGMLQDSETVVAAESGSNNDQLSVVAETISEPEFTNVSSEASNSSQGLPYRNLSVSQSMNQYT